MAQKTRAKPSQKLRKKPSKKPAKKPTRKPSKPKSIDDGENISRMEPMLVAEESKHRGALNELVFELTKTATSFRASLPDGMVESICNLVRSMNCYYSNQIEGHNTHPIDIDRALAGDYSSDNEERKLQKEAKAHIATQRWIDEGGIGDRPTTVGAVLEIHRRFESGLPEELLIVKDPKTGAEQKVIPGELRTGVVAVGRHVPISAGAVPRFLNRWGQVYSRLTPFETVLQAAAAHHRLVWIHPFLDGNGRVTRLVSYAMLLEALDPGGIWSIARGLSRNIDEYKDHLAACDLQRRNDLDGRGSLSEEALARFTKFFLEICLDQVKFMMSLMEPSALRKRIIGWAKEEEGLGTLLDGSTRVLSHILTHRELERKDVQDVTGFSQDKSRRLTAALHNRGIITARTHKAPFRIVFPADIVVRMMPELYPRFPQRHN